MRRHLQQPSLLRFTVVAALLLLLLVSTAAETNRSQTTTSSSSCHTLRVALYPFIPLKSDFFYGIKQDFEARYPEIRLEIIDLSDNYYDPDSPKYIGTTKADVYEVDSVFLYDFASGGRVQELPAELSPRPGEFLANAVKGAQLNGKWYGVPHWVCGDFLFFRSDDAVVRAIRTLADLEKVIGTSHADSKGLFIDMKGRSTLGELYLKSAFDRYVDWPKVEPHIRDFDNDLQADLRRALTLCDKGFCRDSDYHYATGFYGRLFARGMARALVGYSELLYEILLEAKTACPKGRCVTDQNIDVIALPLDDRGAQPISWVDSLMIDRDCDAQCRRDATLFIQFYNSEETLLKALMTTPPRYLLPARTSLYDNAALMAAAPLYRKLKTFIEVAEAPTGKQLNDLLRRNGKTLDKNLPANQ